MPYIKKNQREQLAPALEDLMMAIIGLKDEEGKHINPGAGVFNYVITTLLNNHYEMTFFPSYDKVNTVIGILESAKQEYYRRVAVTYENQKRLENGDVY